MHYRLVYQDNKSHKFWQVTVSSNSYTVCFGKVGTSGTEQVKQAANSQEAIKFAEKLVAQKLKKGYVIESQADDAPKGWLEQLINALIPTYKSEILRYKPANYRAIRLRYSNETFDLGLEEDPEGDYWEHFYSDYFYEHDAVYQFFEFYDDDDEEIERDTWPHEEQDCPALEGFLCSIALAKAYQALVSDQDLVSHLSNIEKITIDIDDSVMLPFTSHFPPQAVRQSLATTFAASDELQALFLDLWQDRLNGPGCALLDDLGIHYERPKKADRRSEFKSAIRQAESFWKDDLNKKSIAVLEPITKELLGEEELYRDELEKACGVLASAYRDNEQLDEALSWYGLGAGLIPHGWTALNFLRALHKAERFDNLLAAAQNHLVHAGRQDRSYCFYSYFYLAIAQVHAGDEAESKKSCQRIRQYVNAKTEENWLEEFVKTLKTLAKNNVPLASTILASEFPEYCDGEQDQEYLAWWKSVPRLAQFNLAKAVGADVEDMQASAIARMWQLQSLQLDRREIDSCDFLKPFTRLRSLQVSNNNICSLLPLQSLTALDDLQLAGNPLQSLDGLPNSLDELCIANCDLLSIEQLRDCGELCELDISGNEIEDISPLSNLKKLKILRAHENPINDISALENLQSLRRLDIEDCPIESGIELLASLPRLTDLQMDYGLAKKHKHILTWQKNFWDELEECLSAEEITEIRQWLEEIKSVDIVRARVLDESEPQFKHALAAIYKLDYLDFDDWELPGLALLGPLKRISSISLENTRIRSLDEISHWRLLQSLDVSQNPGLNISAVSQFVDLQRFMAKDCGLRSVDCLKNLNKLEVLNLSNNPIKSLEALTGLPELRRLHLDGISCGGLSYLSHLKKLQRLSIEAWQGVINLTDLRECKSLRSIHCSSQAEVIGLESLQNLVEFEIR